MGPLRLQAFLRATAAPDRAVVRVASFTVYLNPRDPLRFFNYAIPDDHAAADAETIAALRACFHERDRLPRLEWIEEAAPGVAAALAAAGMSEELRAPLMACEAADVVGAVADVDGLGVHAVGEEDRREAADLQRAAFGQPPLEAGAQPRPSRGGAVLARVGGESVAAASWTPVVEGVSEIVGVATAEAWRGRRLAGVVTAAAARAAFAAGASLCILSPGGEPAERVYARAGFRRVATMLHWSDAD